MGRLLAIVLLLALPCVASAQRIPWPLTGRGPARPSPTPPQPPAIARELSYVRLPYSVETYPLVTRFSTSSVSGQRSSWTSAGLGTRLDFRAAKYLSITADLTSSFVGGPVFTETFEFGTRLHAARDDQRFYPFVDVRIGYLLAHESQSFGSYYVQPYGQSTPTSASFNYSQGLGGVVGVGMEFALSRQFSLIGSASAIRSHMTGFSYGGAPAVGSEYSLTASRYALGLRFNPVRYRRAPSTLPQTISPAQ
jgi:hypothetical protein